ncbi:hypothetical protein SFRURICE_012666 [Spodoptera frugiperda]|nr:hypothetical protein SFRURICE_012666 [Spodoptera frugiperda]
MNEIFSQITKTDNLLLYTSNSQISKRLDFPVPLAIQNIHSIIDVSEFSSYYYNNKVIFILQIPLITPDKFMAYKNIPLPTPHDDSHNTFALIQPSYSYIALSDDRMHYAMLDTLDKCKIINSNLSICELNNIYSCISNPNCESRILTEITLSLPTECNAKLLYGQIDIWQKLKNNKWIYVQSKTNKLTIKCDENIDDHSITGTGIVKLSPNCIGYSKTVQLIPTIYRTCRRSSLSKINLDSLKYATHQMDSLEQELNNLEKESHFIKYGPYYSTFTYILVICLFLYLAYKLYKYFKNKHCSSAGCCVQIFNQCYNHKSKRKSNISKNVEMTEVPSTSEEDNKSVQSLPVQIPKL